MNDKIDMPWFRRAHQLTKNAPHLRSDWLCCLKLKCELKGLDYTKEKLDSQSLEQVCYHWLAEKGYHELKTLPE